MLGQKLRSEKTDTPNKISMKEAVDKTVDALLSTDPDAKVTSSDRDAREKEPSTKVVGLNVISKEEFESHCEVVLDALSDTLAKSFGPYGAPSIIYRHPFSHVTKDGFTIAMSLSTNVAKTFTNQAIANMATDICGRMNNAVGDGTTTAIVATNSIYRSYLEKRQWFEDNGIMPRNILSTFEREKQKIHEELQKHAVPIHIEGGDSTQDEEMIRAIHDVVNISSNGDDSITNTLTTLYKEFGYPSITCEKSVEGEEHVDIVNGYRAPIFITDDMYINSDDKTMQLDEANVLVFTCKVTENIYESLIQPAMLISQYMHQHLLLVCPSIDEVLLDRVIAPRLQAEYRKNHDVSLVICCYKGTNSYQRKTIEDFAMLCHTTPITRARATAMIQATSCKMTAPGVNQESEPPKYTMVELLNFYREWCPSYYPQIRATSTSGNGSINVVPHLPNIEDEKTAVVDKLQPLAIIVPGLPVRSVDETMQIVDEPLILTIGYCKDLELGKKTSIIRTFFYDEKMYELHYREAEDNLKEVEAKYKKLGTFNTETTKAQERLFSLGLKLAHIDVGGDTEMAIGMRKDVYDDAIKAAASAYKYGIINGCNVTTIMAIENILDRVESMDSNPGSIDSQILLLIQDGFIYTYKTVLNNWIPEGKMKIHTYGSVEIEDSLSDIYEEIESKLQMYTKTSLHRLMGCSKQDSYLTFHDVLHKMMDRVRRRNRLFGKTTEWYNFSVYDFLVEFSIMHNVVYDVVDKTFSHSIVNSFQTDDEILTATVDLMSLMISGNQMIVTQRSSFEV